SGMHMRKEDMIRLHALLFQMRRTFEATGLAGGKNYFGDYDSLGVTPVALHRDRRSHQTAIFLLGEALSKAAVEHVGGEAQLRNQLHFIHQPARARL
ncbi:MAG: UPF0058 family protein, partial [Thermoplasmatota archaeon]